MGHPSRYPQTSSCCGAAVACDAAPAASALLALTVISDAMSPPTKPTPSLGARLVPFWAKCSPVMARVLVPAPLTGCSKLAGACAPDMPALPSSCCCTSRDGDRRFAAPALSAWLLLHQLELPVHGLSFPPHARAHQSCKQIGPAAMVFTVLGRSVLPPW